MNWEGHPTTECFLIRQKCLKFPVGVGGGAGGSHIKVMGMLEGKFKLNP